ncbi:MAG: hypothetical protein KDI02_25795 [Anaerolineae bacterium]|nr:hypothetical protein [Anaerolineae bacterium]
MTTAELLNSVQYLVDETGQKKAVQIDLAVWKKILELLEDMEDEEEMSIALQEEDETVSWEDVKIQYQAAHPETDV